MSERTVISTHHDGTFAVAVERLEGGSLAVLVRESRGTIVATALARAELQAMMDISTKGDA